MELDRQQYITTILGTRDQDPEQIAGSMMCESYTGPAADKIAFLRDIRARFRVTYKQTFYSKARQMMRFYLLTDTQGEVLLRLRGES